MIRKKVLTILVLVLLVLVSFIAYYFIIDHSFKNNEVSFYGVENISLDYDYSQSGLKCSLDYDDIKNKEVAYLNCKDSIGLFKNSKEVIINNLLSLDYSGIEIDFIKDKEAYMRVSDSISIVVIDYESYIVNYYYDLYVLDNRLIQYDEVYKEISEPSVEVYISEEEIVVYRTLLMEEGYELILSSF